MELEYGHLYNPQIKKSLQAITTAKLHGQFLSHVMKFVRQYEKHFEELKKKYTALAKEYADLDEHGDLKIDEKGNFNITKGKEAEWMKASTDLLNTKFSIRKLSYQDLIDAGVKLSPQEVMDLEPILDGVEDSV